MIRYDIGQHEGPPPNLSRARHGERGPHAPNGEHTYKVRNIDTGVVLERQGPDAREMVASRLYEFAEPDAATVFDKLRALSHAQLCDLLAAVGPLEGCSPMFSQPHLALAILPHAERNLFTFPEN